MAFQWDPVWFGVLLTMKVAIGQFTPPMAVNLMVSCRLAQVRIESTLPWVGWLVVCVSCWPLRRWSFPQSRCGCRATGLLIQLETAEETPHEQTS